MHKQQYCPSGTKALPGLPESANVCFGRGNQGTSPSLIRSCGQDYSFTPPTATPAMMYLDRQKYTISSGSAVSVRPR